MHHTSITHKMFINKLFRKKIISLIEGYVYLLARFVYVCYKKKKRVLTPK